MHRCFCYDLVLTESRALQGGLQADRVADEIGDLPQAQLVLLLNVLEARVPQGLNQRLVKLMLRVPAAR